MDQINQSQSRKHAVMIVVWTLAFIAASYMVTMALCAIWRIEPPDKVLGALKDVGLVAIGGLTGLLARTSSTDESMTSKVEIQQPTSNPIPVDQVHDPKE